MNVYVSSLFRSIFLLIFPLPDRKKNLPQSYRYFTQTFLPHSQKYTGITYFLRYKDLYVKEVIEELKRYNNPRYFDFVGKVIAQDILIQKTHSYPVFLIPLPQTKKRLRERGYDVTKSLVSAILRDLPQESFRDGSGSLKHNRTYHQSGIKNRQERLNASHGMFKITSRASLLPPGSSCILIDDVCTTGASMHEAERILEEIGHTVLRKITLAHS